ncbi:MAG TPA: NAD(P)-dependent alcohol dehydrogenase [Bryobacteraceae bacterium]|nr:NAD(P)-dependent alcohol dehydrogenase [Bryobacteraceae bacterium]
MGNSGDTQVREIKAAVVRDKGGPFQIETLTLEAPRRDEVLIRIVAGGMCHTDMVARDKVYDVPHPIVLGHEGAGIVESVGEDVLKVVPGDPVVLTYMWCGHCKPCYLGKPFYCERAYPLCFGGAREDGSTATTDRHGAKVYDHFFGQSSFGTYALAHERNVVKIRRDAPLEILGPLGCGIQTGAGAVINALKVRPGASFATFGAGAVGLAAVMAARIAGATTIIAADVVPSRLEMAKELGATHTVNSRETDPVKTIAEVTRGGVDFSLEATGRPEVLRQAIDALGPLGACGIVGAAPLGAEASFDINGVMLPGNKILGIIEGESVPDLFIPQLVELHMQGRLPFDKFVKFYSLDEINQAAEDSEKGGTIKPIVRMA